MPRHAAVVLGAMASWLLAACAVGPNYHRPEMPEARINPVQLPASADQKFLIGGDVPTAWWRAFGSDALNELVDRALKSNPDLAAARATFKIAEENYKAGIGSFFPNVGASFDLTNAKDATAAVQPTAASGKPAYRLETAQLNLSYTLDLLGGTRRQVEALSAQAKSQRFAMAAAYVGLTVNVVDAAIADASLADQVRAAEAIVRAEEEALTILRRQLAAGQIAELDVIAQQAALGQSQQALEDLRKQHALARNLLAALCGEADAENIPAFTLSALKLPAELPVSVSSMLLAHRADIRAAEETLHAASAQVGVATAAMLPNISLTAAWGSTANHTPDLFQPGTTLWNISSGVVQPIFEGGTLLHKRRAAVASYEQALAQYRSTVLAGFRAVADALASVDSDAKALTAATVAEQAASESLRIVTRQVDLGESGYLALLSSQQAYQQAAQTLIQVEANRLNDSVALIAGLGGDWWSQPEVVMGQPARNSTVSGL